MLNKKKKQHAKFQQQQKKSIMELNYEKIKQKCFQIFISQNVISNKNVFMNFNNIQKQYGILYVNINNVYGQQQNDFYNKVIKSFGSIFHIDYCRLKQFESKIYNLLKNCNQVLKLIQKFKNQRRQFQQNKIKYEFKISSYESLQKKYYLTQINSNSQILNQKNQNDEKTKNYQQRIKNIQEKRKQLNKIIQNQNQKIDQLLNENQLIKLQNHNLKLKIKQLIDNNQKLNTKQLIDKKSQITKPYKPNLQNQDKLQIIQQISSLFQKVYFKNPQTIKILLQFIGPDSLVSLLSLNKSLRILILSSSLNISTMFKSILRSKKYEIERLHYHIQYFQNSLDKIPEQIIKQTYYKCNILKQPIGGNFLQIIKICGLIFEGKISYFSFSSHNKQTEQHNQIIRQYIQSKYIQNHLEYINEQQFYDNELQLNIDNQVISHFKQQRKSYKQHTIKQIESMYNKLLMNQNIYKVDSDIIRQFYSNIIRNFTILFVLSRDLFTEARSLQQLNTFILAKLNHLSKFQIQKKFDLQDIKAQLASQKKLKQFLSNKCQKIQEKYLKLNKQNIQLQLQIKYFDEKIKSKNILLQNQKKLLDKKINQNQELVRKYNQIKKFYQQNRQKYNDLIKELAIVKQLTKKMNFLSQ